MSTVHLHRAKAMSFWDGFLWNSTCYSHSIAAMIKEIFAFAFCVYTWSLWYVHGFWKQHEERHTLQLLATLSYSSDSNVTRTSNTNPVQSDSDLKQWQKVREKYTGKPFNEKSGSYFLGVLWVPLSMSTLGPTFCMSTLAATLNRNSRSGFQWVHEQTKAIESFHIAAMLISVQRSLPVVAGCLFHLNLL